MLAANTAQRDFLSNVSHDLKTPLTSIQGYAQAIIDGAAEDTGEAAQIIYEEAGRLNRMVVELTDLERLQAGRLSMASDRIDMAQLTLSARCRAWQSSRKSSRSVLNRLSSRRRQLSAMAIAWRRY